MHDLRNLAGHGGEDFPGIRALGDQRGYPPQRGLFLRQPLDLGPCVTIGDRRSHEFGEDGQPVQGIGGQRRAFVAGRHHHRTPDTTVNENGNGGGHADAELPG